MKLKCTLFIATVAVFAAKGHAQDRPESTLIPKPVSIEFGDGSFRLTSETRVLANDEVAARKLLETLAPATGYRLKLIKEGELVEYKYRFTIALRADERLATKFGQEGYGLGVKPEYIVIYAAKPAGLFYGIQTLRQLLPVEIFSKKPVDDIDWVVPCVDITDYPRFGWRGLLIDPARHFIPVEDVKRFIYMMALHKFNRLQMHLTDNEGWRIEIKKYPKLTEIGSQMDWTFRRRNGTGPRCFGFYTQEDIRDLVRYAAERYVTIVPEIEMPYHTGSAIVASGSGPISG